MQRTFAHRPLPPMISVGEHYTTGIPREKREGRHAGERSRTFTALRPTDFESAASAIPPLRRLGANLSDRGGYCKTATVGCGAGVVSIRFCDSHGAVFWRRFRVFFL